MNTQASVLLIGVLAFGIAHTEESVVLGRALKNGYIEDVEIPCPPERICMDAWFRWTVTVDTTLHGPKVSGRIVAARIQHAQFVPRHQKKLRMFVLDRIEDETQRKLLRAEYYLRDMSIVHEMYCLDSETELGIDAEDKLTGPGIQDQYCFKLPEDSEDG